ncbi:MAG TPA: Dam family site-specific DNA-(adenine-N6)-methyltransferase [Chthoniobacterales bacterium]
MKVIVPPIKSQGIKTKLVPWIMDQITEKDREGRWIEPFMGTGIVGLNSRFERALISDINPHLIAFYKAVRAGEITAQKVEEFLIEEGEKLRTAEEGGYVHYRAVRDRFNADFAPLDFLFLNRAGFNGMIRFSKKGKWNIPFLEKAGTIPTGLPHENCKSGEERPSDHQTKVGVYRRPIRQDVGAS